jgi:hypothetical protein
MGKRMTALILADLRLALDDNTVHCEPSNPAALIAI